MDINIVNNFAPLFCTIEVRRRASFRCHRPDQAYFSGITAHPEALSIVDPSPILSTIFPSKSVQRPPEPSKIIDR
ncbi:hypothetical protein DM50_2831 [Burkholderia mallei]|nr:hypothetical protein DM50_2831 [Burkholderia mallei]KOT19604.1 hypothetical protein DM52_420 [Burkholderia mallei]